ncbi:MAG TPA: DUF6194 family protein [Acidimicrobiia bacterium]
MTSDEVVDFVETELEGTVAVVASEEDGAPDVAWGDTFFFYDPDGVTEPEKRLPYATIVVNDYPGFDEASNLSRDGVFRVNAWVSRETFEREVPRDQSNIDFTVLDEVIPHPVYGEQSWVSVLNPGPATEDKVKALLSEAHRNHKDRYEKRRSKRVDSS